jgi:hypothetical protein
MKRDFTVALLWGETYGQTYSRCITCHIIVLGGNSTPAISEIEKQKVKEGKYSMTTVNHLTVY